MKEYPVVYLNNKHKSFSWANGLYFLIDMTEDKEFSTLAKLNEDGTPDRYNDGELNICTSGTCNTEKTNLVYKTDEIIPPF